MNESVQRPTLTADEQARLKQHEQPLQVARSVLDDLEEIGADVTGHRELLDRTETMRAGLLDKFSNASYVAPKSPRRGK